MAEKTTYRDVIRQAQSAVDDFSEYLPQLEKKTYARLQRLLNRLVIDPDGRIEVSEENMKVLDEVKEELQQLIRDPHYKKQVAGLKRTITDIIDTQTAYFSTQFADFLKPDVMKSIEKAAFENAVTSLTETGMNANVVDKAVDIVQRSVTSGATFMDMTYELKDFMVSTPEVPGHLQSYAKQIVNDTIHNVSRNYNGIVADDLGLEWYRYVGGLMKTSRPWCVALEEKEFIHKSELARICRGDIEGRKVSLQGLIPGTNKENVVNRCGGYNCEHHMAPVPNASVPTALRREYEPDVKPDDEELTAGRPRNKRK